MSFKNYDTKRSYVVQKVEREWNIVEAQQEQGAHERDFSVSDGWQVKYIDRRSTLLKREHVLPCSQKRDKDLNARRRETFTKTNSQETGLLKQAVFLMYIPCACHLLIMQEVAGHMC